MFVSVKHQFIRLVSHMTFMQTTVEFKKKVKKKISKINYHLWLIYTKVCY